MHGLIRSSLSNNHFQQLYRSQSHNPVVDRDMSLLPTYRSVMLLSDLKAAARADQESMRSAPPYH
jgi:hypothetical protein